MAYNERNLREAEKEIQFSTRSCKTKQEITENENKTAKEFNKYFTSVGIALVSNIPIVTKKTFSSRIRKKNAFKKLKRNKVIGCDGLNGNIIMDIYDSTKVILFKTFKAFLEKAVFPEKICNCKSNSSF